MDDEKKKKLWGGNTVWDFQIYYILLWTEHALGGIGCRTRPGPGSPLPQLLLPLGHSSGISVALASRGPK